MKKLIIFVLLLVSANIFANTNLTELKSISSNVAESNTADQPYIGSNDFSTYNVGGYGEMQFGSGNSSALNSGVDNSLAGRFDFGAKISPYYGVEGGVTMLSQPTAGNMTAPIEIYDMSAKAYLPVNSRFDVHGQVGAAFAVMSSQTVGIDGKSYPGNNSSGGFKALIGVGGDFYLTKSFAITANDYNYLGNDQTTGGGNTNIIMGGLKYDFK